MAKPDKPLLSLGAKGTISDTLTYQKRGQDTIVREKPIPTYRRTDAQNKHRFLFLEATHYWELLTNAQKQLWRTAASRYHITGRNLFMRHHLSRMDYPILSLPMDENTGSTTKDYSLNQITANIIGASWTTGHFGSALYFDRVDDYVDCGDRAIWNVPRLTIECWFRNEFTPTVAWQSTIVSKDYRQWEVMIILVAGIVRLAAYIGDGTNYDFYNSLWTPSLNTLYHLALTIDGTNVRFYINGSLIKTLTQIKQIGARAAPLRIGIRPAVSEDFEGMIDEFRLYDNAQPSPNIKNHYERSLTP